MRYDEETALYLPMETQFHLKLISKNKNSEPKLVGRMTFDVSQLMNGDVNAF